jgi:hypothetical protein
LTKLQGVPIRALAFSSVDEVKSEQKYELRSGDIIFSSNNFISILNLEIVQGELNEKLEASVMQVTSQFDILAI